MRRWLVALALVPVVAWGQGMTAQQCMSEQAHLQFAEIALAVMERKASGVEERAVAMSVMGEGQLSAVMLAGIDAVYRTSQPSPSQVARAMAITCHDYASGR